MPGILNPTLTVEEIVAEPDLGYNTTRGKVPTLVITVSYELALSSMERQLPRHHFGYWESIVVKGTRIGTLISGFLEIPEGEPPITLPREVTRLVEKKFLTDQLGLFGSIPIQCTISVAPEPSPSRKADTNTVTLPGAQYWSTVALAQIVNTMFWIRDQAMGRYEREG